MAENCAVCISALGVEVYVPCSNNHKFHAKCLLEWATTLHNCPICRENFDKIRVLNDGSEIKTVKPPKLIREKREQLDTVIMDVPYDTMSCELCHQATDEAHMLVCDACDLGFHMYCLVPPLRAVPRGLWECEGCRPRRDAAVPSTSLAGASNSSARNATNRRRANRRATVSDIDDDALAIEDFVVDDEEEEDNSDSDHPVEEGGEISTDSTSDASTQKLDADYATEDEGVLRHDYAHDPSLPSTSRQPTVTMKEMREKKRRKKSKKGKRKSSKSKRKSDGSPTKKKKKRKSRKKHKKCDRTVDEDASKSAHRRIAAVCGIDLKHSDRYKVVRRGAKRTGASSSAAASTGGASIAPLGGRLQLLGREWIPPPDDSSAEVAAAAMVSGGDPTTSTDNTSLLPSSSFTGSLSLLDEILANQSKVLAPGKLLKVKRDGTLEETDELREYLEKKRKKIEDAKNPSKIEAKKPKFTASDRLFDELVKSSNSHADSKVKSEPRHHPRTHSKKHDKTLEVEGDRRKLAGVKQEEGNDFKFAVPRLPPPSSSSLWERRRPPPPPPPAPHPSPAAGTTQKSVTLGGSSFSSSVPTTDPKSNKPMLVVKPEVEWGRGDRVKFSGDSQATETSSSGVRCGLDSPMDIEDDDEDDQPSSSNRKSARDEKKHASPSSTTITKKDRSETIKLADAAMKTALKPYFTKRMISKEEYKEIMKKGVAKLREKNALKPEKVDRFVKQYVELIAKRRQK